MNPNVVVLNIGDLRDNMMLARKRVRDGKARSSLKGSRGYL
jgi:hypothetical protein